MGICWHTKSVILMSNRLGYKEKLTHILEKHSPLFLMILREETNWNIVAEKINRKGDRHSERIFLVFYHGFKNIRALMDTFCWRSQNMEKHDRQLKLARSLIMMVMVVVIPKWSFKSETTVHRRCKLLQFSRSHHLPKGGNHLDITCRQTNPHHWVVSTTITGTHNAVIILVI